MISNSISGTNALLQGFRLIATPGLRRYVMAPLLINVALFGLATWGIVTQVPALSAWLLSYLPGWLSWLEWLLEPVLYLAGLIVAFVAVLMFANVIAAPFNALLAEKVEKHLSGQPVASQGFGQIVRSVPALIASELRKILYFALRALPLLILFIIPGINLIAPVTWFLFSAWFLTLTYIDYPMGNHNLLYRKQRDYLRGHRVLSLSFGSAALALTMIPILNFVAIPVAVAGATALWVKSRDPGANTRSPSQN